MLGQAGSSKIPLGRSVLMAQLRHNKTPSGKLGECCIRCAPEVDFVRGEPGSLIMGDFLDDAGMNMLSTKVLSSLLDVGLYEHLAWAGWGAASGFKTNPGLWDHRRLFDGIDPPRTVRLKG